VSTFGFIKDELLAAIARGVSQCVVIGGRLALGDALSCVPDKRFRIFAVDQEPPPDSPATFVPTAFDAQTLEAALSRSHFDKSKSTVFLWVGGPGYRTADAALSSLGFVASLPQGSGVVLDYAAERCPRRPLRQYALDALASGVCVADGIKYLIQPQAVEVMLRGLGFQHVVDFDLGSERHLVSAVL
jgi:O-methyltransferase involved in polyketide biosynthesis